MAKPVISYPGAKWRFYPHMKEYFPKDMKVFVEPFLGGGSVTLSVADDPEFSKLERIVAGDLAPEIWAMWTGIKNNADDVIDIAERTFKKHCPTKLILPNDISKIDQKSEEFLKAVEEAREFWKWTQTVDCKTLSIPERAARTFLAYRVSFSGMGDSGSLSKENFFSFGLDKLERIKGTEELLSRVEILNASFEETMSYANIDPDNSFIFLDPPYYKQESSGLYGKNGNTHKGFPHLQFAEYTKSMKCKWFMTYDDSVYVRKMFKGKDDNGNRIHIKPFTIPGGYTMALKASEDALAGEEVFIMNYKSEDADYNLINSL